MVRSTRAVHFELVPPQWLRRHCDTDYGGPGGRPRARRPARLSMQVLAWTTRDQARICPITGRYGRCFGLRDNLVFSVAARGGPAALERVIVTELARDRAKGDWGGAPGPPGPLPVQAGRGLSGRPVHGSSSTGSPTATRPGSTVEP